MVSCHTRRRITYTVLSFFTILFVGLLVGVNGESVPDRLDLPSGATGHLYWPEGYEVSFGERGLVIALHGLRQTPAEALAVWTPVAERLNLVVLVPSGNVYEQGYTREPVDDRVRIRELRDHMVARYGVDPARVYVAGFSRGGNYAIELGIQYPDIFPRVMCLYGFYNSVNTPILTEGLSENLYRRSHFYLITGHGDMTEKSLTAFHSTLKENGIATKLHVFPNLFHAYPPNFPEFFRDVLRTWRESSR
jgi:hypothetical protein